MIRRGSFREAIDASATKEGFRAKGNGRHMGGGAGRRDRVAGKEAETLFVD